MESVGPASDIQPPTSDLDVTVADTARGESAPQVPDSSSKPGAESSNSTSTLNKDKPKSFWPAAILAMAVVLLGVGWRVYKKTQQAGLGDSSSDTELVRAESRLPVRVAKARTGLAQEWVFDEGTVWPVQRRVLNFEASGEVTYIARPGGRELREGDRVPKGELLAQIDDRNQNASITTANADVQVAIQQEQQAQASLAQAKAGERQALADLDLQRTELKRYQELYDSGAVSASDRDIYLNRVIQAEAALSSAEQDVRSAENGIRSAEAQIEAAGAKLKQSSVALEDTQLISPIDGLLAYINIREGEYWTSSRLDSSSDQRLIETAPMVVVDPNSFEVILEVQSELADDVRAGQVAYVVLENEVSAAQAAGASNNTLLKLAEERGSQGSVFSVSPSSAPGSRGTKITIRDLTALDRLKVGGRVYVWLEVAAKPNAVLIPFKAIVLRDQQAYVFVVNDDDTVTRREVTPGVEGLTGVEILAGVTAGEKVVIEGGNRLVEGAPVDVVDVGGVR